MEEQRGWFGDRRQKPMLPCGIEIISHDLTTVIDPQGIGKHAAGNINRHKTALAVQKPMVPRGIGIEAHDLATVIDPEGTEERGVRNINVVNV